jgi:hypothetical protein
MAKFKSLSEFIVEARTSGAKNKAPKKTYIPEPPFAGQSASGFWIPENDLASVKAEFEKYLNARVDDLKNRISNLKGMKEINWLLKMFGRWFLGKNYKYWLGLEAYTVLSDKTKSLESQILNEAGIFNWFKKKDDTESKPEKGSLKNKLFKIIDAWADEIRQSMNLFFDKRMKDKFLKKSPVSEKPPEVSFAPVQNSPVEAAPIETDNIETDNLIKPPSDLDNNIDDKKPVVEKPAKRTRAKKITTNPDFKQEDQPAPPSKIIEPQSTESGKKKVRVIEPAPVAKKPPVVVPKKQDEDEPPKVIPGFYEHSDYEIENKKQNIVFNDATLYERTLICLEKIREIKS